MSQFEEKIGSEKVKVSMSCQEYGNDNQAETAENVDNLDKFYTLWREGGYMYR